MALIQTAINSNTQLYVQTSATKMNGMKATADFFNLPFYCPWLSFQQTSTQVGWLVWKCLIHNVSFHSHSTVCLSRLDWALKSTEIQLQNLSTQKEVKQLITELDSYSTHLLINESFILTIHQFRLNWISCMDSICRSIIFILQLIVYYSINNRFCSPLKHCYTFWCAESALSISF